MEQNAGVHNPRVIDLVTHHPDTDEYALIMVETRPWDGSEARLLELQAKLNTYAAYALDGPMARDYPASVGKPLRIQLDCAQQPDPATAEFLDVVAERLAQDGIRFVVNRLD